MKVIHVTIRRLDEVNGEPLAVVWTDRGEVWFTGDVARTYRELQERATRDGCFIEFDDRKAEYR